MIARLRRFLMLLGGFAVFALFTILTPTRVWASIMMVVLGAALLWLMWQVAKDPWPWTRKPPANHE